MRRTALLGIVSAVAGAWAPSALDAQNCKKGIPCGNSCIAANKTCRVGSGSATSSSSGSSSAGQGSKSLYGQPTSPAPRSPSPADSQWVASVADGIYFLRSCSAAQDLHPSNRRYFAYEGDAITAGFRRSRAEGC